MQIGTVIKLKVQCMGNPIGTLGVCYDHYELDGRDGYGIIFENGEYDGFSPDEVEAFLEVLHVWEPGTMYQFKNVIQLSRDFEHGMFQDAFTNKEG